MSIRPNPIRRFLAAAARARTEIRLWWRQTNRDQWVALAITLVCFGAMSVWVHNVASNATSAAHGVRTQGRERTSDLIDRCLATSRSTAQDVLLNWQHYQSEAGLAKPPTTRQTNDYKQLLASLPVQFRPLVIQVLAPSRSGHAIAVLQALAASDFNAAYVKAHTVDKQYATLIPLKTATGEASQPRNWIITAHYSCRAQFTHGQ